MLACRLVLVLVVCSADLSAGGEGGLLSCSQGYDLDAIISQINLQFCTIIEIGQGYCSLFVEFRSSPSNTELPLDGVAELYLGTCECATLRNWEFCSLPLRKARPYECSFEEGLPNANSSARVHRRFCDPTMMVQVNEACDCGKQFAQRTLYPVEGFLTCYRAPLPKSICSTHSVCGVARCAAKNLYGLALVQCDPNCIYQQPFCEEYGPVTSKAPVVTSIWSDWTGCRREDAEGFEVAEAICLEEGTHAPAFDCLGPGSYCCPPEVEFCECEVTTTMAEMKVTRYISKRGVNKRGFISNKLHELSKTWNHLKTSILGGHEDLTWLYGSSANRSISYQVPGSLRQTNMGPSTNI